MEDSITIIRENDKQILLKVVREIMAIDKVYTVIKYEWWFDRKMQEKGITEDNNGNVFCQTIVGMAEDKIIRCFEKGKVIFTRERNFYERE